MLLKSGGTSLARLLEFSATTETQLSEFATLLESRDAPHVVAFGQLPLDLGLGSVVLDAPGDAPNTSVELHVRPFKMQFDSSGRLNSFQASADPEVVAEMTITQVAGVIRLDCERARIHPVYTARLSNLGLMAAPLANHRIESWMRLPEASLAEPTRLRRPLTGIDFQRDVAARARDHLAFATRALLNAYGVAALLDVQAKWFLYGYHAMIAPGRLAAAGAPVPVLRGLVNSKEQPTNVRLALSEICDVIKNTRRAQDPFIRRLQALNALSRNGEPELALVGCCTALEWFLNQQFSDLSYKRKDEIRTGNLRSFLSSKHASVLPDADSIALRTLIDWRNDVAHGSPPNRENHGADCEEIVRSQDALYLALRIYRAVNCTKNRDTNNENPQKNGV